MAKQLVDSNIGWRKPEDNDMRYFFNFAIVYITTKIKFLYRIPWRAGENSNSNYPPVWTQKPDSPEATPGWLYIFNWSKQNCLNCSPQQQTFWPGWNFAYTKLLTPPTPHPSTSQVIAKFKADH